MGLAVRGSSGTAPGSILYDSTAQQTLHVSKQTTCSSYQFHREVAAAICGNARKTVNHDAKSASLLTHHSSPDADPPPLGRATAAMLPNPHQDPNTKLSTGCQPFPPPPHTQVTI
jgi:hypothetical protein